MPLSVSGSRFKCVNGTYSLVQSLPDDAIQQPQKGHPIWQHDTRKEIHILFVQGMWWISHYQPSDKGGKDYHHAGEIQGQWFVSGSGKEANLTFA